MDSHAHHNDPDKAPAQPSAEMKQCQTCRAKFPVSAYGLSKLSSNGRNKQCNECRSQYQRLQRTLKYGTVSKVDDSIIRSVLHQNENVIRLALALTTCETECRAFDVSTKVDYKVFFGRSERLGMSSMALFDMAGTMYHEYSYSTSRDVVPTMLAVLKSLNLRLELTEVDAIAAKTLIYYV